MGLKNVHILWHPLREDDHSSFIYIHNRLLTIGEPICTKRQQAQSKYQAKRWQRMDAQLHIINGNDGMNEETQDQFI